MENLHLCTLLSAIKNWSCDSVLSFPNFEAYHDLTKVPEDELIGLIA